MKLTIGQWAMLPIETRRALDLEADQIRELIAAGWIVLPPHQAARIL